MSRIDLAPEVGDDFDRSLAHLADHDSADAPLRIGEIIKPIAVLEQDPLIGRPAYANTRELVIGRRSHGNAALYRYIPEIDMVFVLALRSQREAGCTRT